MVQILRLVPLRILQRFLGFQQVYFGLMNQIYNVKIKISMKKRFNVCKVYWTNKKGLQRWLSNLMLMMMNLSKWD
nr:MAG TPA: hypothetical protein [Caudoviricetes sp.]